MEGWEEGAAGGRRRLREVEERALPIGARTKQPQVWILGAPGHHLHRATGTRLVPLPSYPPCQEEQGTPEAKVGVYVEIPLVEGYDAGDVQDAVRSKVVKLDPVQLEELHQEWMDRGGKPPL